MRDKKTMVMVAWLCIALVFLGLLGFLALDAPGLVIDVQTRPESFDELDVVVSNQSQHTINQIQVLFGEQTLTQLGTILALKPGEKKSFSIPTQDAKITVKAMARFHRTAEKSLFLQAQKPFDVTIEVPQNLVTDREFQLLVRVCNHSPETNISVTETHSPTFFAAEFQTKQLTVAQNECMNAFFSFTPVFSGATVVFFNVKSDTLSETIEKELVIDTG